MRKITTNKSNQKGPASTRARSSTRGGFTLLFASLVVSLVLAIGLAIANISLQQFLLSSSGKESQVAFYNADSGIECALYYDHGKVPGFYFPTSPSEQDGTTITCGGQIALIDETRTFYNAPTTTTTYLINPPGKECEGTSLGLPSYLIEVNKAPAALVETFKTVIRSRGYNICDNTNPRRVERGLEITY